MRAVKGLRERSRSKIGFSATIENSPPDAEMLPLMGTNGTILVWRRSHILSISSHLTPEWPRISEFMRMSIAPRTHDSGIVVEPTGSKRGRVSRTSVEEGRIPLL